MPFATSSSMENVIESHWVRVDLVSQSVAPRDLPGQNAEISSIREVKSGDSQRFHSPSQALMEAKTGGERMGYQAYGSHGLVKPV